MKTIYNKLFILLLLLPFSMLAQSTLSGTVTDSKTNQAIPGVNVKVKGGTNGTATDLDGKFKLSNVKKGDVLTFSYIGYKDISVNYNEQKGLNIQMEEESNQLQEVQIQVGYGTVKKKDLTGSTTTIAAKDFNKGANVTTENLLNGRVAGLTINTSGAPGSGSQIRIRGGASLTASNDPLIVLDGFPLENATGTGSTSFLASLNPSIVESITVLKDASATAIYGSRASNGVIIINTKKGGKTLSVEYNVQYGSGRYIKTTPVFSGDEFRALIQQKFPTTNTTSPDYNANLAVNNRLGTANTNWQDEIYRRTDFIDQSATLRGNLFNAIPTRLTLGTTYQQGLRLTNAFQRNTVGLALNPSFFKSHLKIRLNANYTNETNRFADGVEGSAISFDPTQPVYKAGSPYGGFFEYYTGPNSDGKFPLQANTNRNPVAQLMGVNDMGLNNRVFGNFELDYKFHFLPALRAVVNVGFDQSKGERKKRFGSDVASGPSNNNIPFGKNEFENSTRSNKLLDAYFVYNNSFSNFTYDFTAGYSYQKFIYESFSSGNVSDPGYTVANSDINKEVPNVLIGFFARTNLNYKDKYLLTLSYRRDGSSRFSKDNRWGNFPAVAFAWKLKEEFFKDNKTISDFKLRLGYGITGQQDLVDQDAKNSYLQKYNVGGASSQYFFGPSAVPIAISERLSNNLKWEETVTYNAGFDFGLLDNRITGSIEGFYKDSKDLLVDAAISDGSNFSNRAYQNIGNFTTKGIEFTINADVVRTKDLNWNINFNASKFERRIQNLVFGDNIFVGEGLGATGTTGQVHSEQFTPFSYFVFKQLYDNSNKPIEGAYADLNNDGIINEQDRYIYKNPDPDATFGFASNLNYKNIDFSFNLRASIGNNVFNQVAASRAQYDLLRNGNALNNLPTSVLDTGFNTTSQVILSDLYVENASFLRMDNITLGYTFPNWLEGQASIRFSAGVQNAFLITKYKGIDPEVTKNGVDNDIYPRQRSFLFGVNIKF